MFLPFIAPPSSPASFLHSGPSSASHTPHGLLCFPVNTYSLNEPSSAFEIGPYAHETQPVTPPVDSAYTTRPSTAPFTPPPESGQMSSATPSSPEVPYAQLLTSSLERAGRNSGGMDQQFSAAHYEFQSHQVYPGSPGGNLISPGSGTSSPYPGKCSILEFRIGEPPKFLGFEHFTARKWGSRFGSGSITPAGHGSRLGSGALTPDGSGGLGSMLASGAVTPNGNLTSLEGSVFGYSDHHGSSWSDKTWGETESVQRTFSLGSSKEFKFDNTEEVVRSEWWSNEKVAPESDDSPGNSWSFFPVLRSGGFS